MSLKKILLKVDSEFENGLRYKATDRLRNLIQEYPNNIELRNKLAEFYYESGFLDSAGKYWILTEPTDDRIRKCVEIYKKSVNYSGNRILTELVFRGEKSKLPKYAQQKLSELELDSKKKVNHIPKFYPKSNTQKSNNSENKNNFKEKLIGLIFFSAIALIVILIIVGLISVINWLF